jgi:hypothetical protein
MCNHDQKASCSAWNSHFALTTSSCAALLAGTRGRRRRVHIGLGVIGGVHDYHEVLLWVSFDKPSNQIGHLIRQHGRYDEGEQQRDVRRDERNDGMDRNVYGAARLAGRFLEVENDGCL